MKNADGVVMAWGILRLIARQAKNPSPNCNNRDHTVSRVYPKNDSSRRAPNRRVK